MQIKPKLYTLLSSQLIKQRPVLLNEKAFKLQFTLLYSPTDTAPQFLRNWPFTKMLSMTAVPDL